MGVRSSFAPDIRLCLGLENIISSQSRHVFSCNCCSPTLIPEPINCSTDWLHHIDLENDYWPSSISDLDKFVKALDIVRVRDFNNSPFLYKFEFSSRFIDELIASQSNKLKILHQSVKRLTLTSEQAACDASLRDEYLAKKREYRFRVTPRPNSTRIHYSYDRSGSIIFLRYYGVGHHDNGL